MHGGTNDLSKDIKTVDNFKKIHDYLKVHSPATKLVISALTTRKDQPGLDKRVRDTNSRLEMFQQRITSILLAMIVLMVHA